MHILMDADGNGGGAGRPAGVGGCWTRPIVARACLWVVRLKAPPRCPRCPEDIWDRIAVLCPRACDI